ncbi:MAG: glutamine-hydrolyzing carbamoyl-phosphate synthase small subunit [Spirochaetales bacterium]|nr:glutamine-hydrolyzing carbamoyl-phosphate synthase small subunit [Spirochaetales bacterium]
MVLENGEVFRGKLFGAALASAGEVCFNTSMSGYQEILTDPSYAKQIITFTYPMIGNYGVHPDFMESRRIHAAGCVVREYVHGHSSHLARSSLHDLLVECGRPGIEGVDTRRLVLMLRSQGAMRGGIFPGAYSQGMLEEVRAFPQMEGLDLASAVSTDHSYAYGVHRPDRLELACLDFGVKESILRLLDEAGFNVTVFPARTPAGNLEHFDAYFLSNGPGDPATLQYAVQTIRQLIAGGKPIFGICLGHQLLSLATGQSTYKLKFGHRGGNQPVKDKKTGRVEITSQNHGFAVHDSREDVVSHVNLNDATVEGFRGPQILSIQYHPEASPGPHDSRYLFSEFYGMVRAGRADVVSQS